MNDLIEVWLGISILGSGASLFVGTFVALVTAGYRRTRSEARAIVYAYSLVPLSWIWPMLLIAGVVFGVPKLLSGVWTEAGFSTLAERREEKRLSRERVLQKELAKRKQIIKQLEREAGIPKEVA